MRDITEQSLLAAAKSAYNDLQDLQEAGERCKQQKRDREKQAQKLSKSIEARLKTLEIDESVLAAVQGLDPNPPEPAVEPTAQGSSPKQLSRQKTKSSQRERAPANDKVAREASVSQKSNTFTDQPLGSTTRPRSATFDPTIRFNAEFDIADIDGIGTISVAEAETLVKLKLDREPTADELAPVFAKCSNGTLTKQVTHKTSMVMLSFCWVGMGGSLHDNGASRF